MKGHPELQTYLQDHPEFRETVRKDPDAFTRADDDRYARNDNDARDRDTRADNDRDRDARRDNDNRYRQRDTDDRDRDAHRDQLASFDRYLDSHRETAEQIRRDPSLVNNDEFLKNHPSLQTYLQQHPGVHEEFSQNPDAFMRREQRFEIGTGRPASSTGFPGPATRWDRIAARLRQTDRTRRFPRRSNREMSAKHLAFAGPAASE